MTSAQESSDNIPLLIPQSRGFTDENKTGFWRFVRPCYENKTAPCSAACPVGEDISRIEMLVARGLFKQAWETILQENPFPSVCGRVCFHPCEKSCNRKDLDQPVSINRLERFIGDTAVQDDMIPALKLLPSTGKKIAVIGAGPAGLSMAWFATQLGYQCDVFEAQSSPGGLLRWGIPGYRLPDSVLSSEIRRIRNLGVNIQCDRPVDREFLASAGTSYDAVFVGCGHGRSLPMNVPGEDTALDGLEFLRNIRNGSAAPIHGEVAVIGGGNSAVDVARSLIRTGARPVIIYRRRKIDMPAFEHEIRTAVKEGIDIRELLSPVRIDSTDDGYVITLQKMKVSDTDTDGRARVIPESSNTRTMRFSRIFSAIGAEAEARWRPPYHLHDRSILHLSHCILQQVDLPIVYGGDLTNDVKSVTDAIASGKQAAMALDLLFKRGKTPSKRNLPHAGSETVLPCPWRFIWAENESSVPLMSWPFLKSIPIILCLPRGPSIPACLSRKASGPLQKPTTRFLFPRRFRKHSDVSTAGCATTATTAGCSVLKLPSKRIHPAAPSTWLTAKDAVSVWKNAPATPWP